MTQTLRLSNERASVVVWRGTQTSSHKSRSLLTPEHGHTFSASTTIYTVKTTQTSINKDTAISVNQGDYEHKKEKTKFIGKKEINKGRERKGKGKGLGRKWNNKTTNLFACFVVERPGHINGARLVLHRKRSAVVAARNFVANLGGCSRQRKDKSNWTVKQPQQRTTYIHPYPWR